MLRSVCVKCIDWTLMNGKKEGNTARLVDKVWKKGPIKRNFWCLTGGQNRPFCVAKAFG